MDQISLVKLSYVLPHAGYILENLLEIRPCKVNSLFSQHPASASTINAIFFITVTTALKLCACYVNE